MITALAFVASGCGGDRVVVGIRLHNDLGETVRISYADGGSEISAVDDWSGDVIDPGDLKGFGFNLYDDGAPSPTGSPPRRCMSGDIIARDLDGNEVARILGPECEGRTIILSNWASP